MEKLKELFANRRFVMIFSGFIGLIGLIIIFKSRQKTEEAPDDSADLKAKLLETKKSLKLVKKRNEELEKKAHGHVIRQGSSGVPKPPKSAAGKKGEGAPIEEPVIDDPADDEDEPADE